jgi:phage-related protein
MAILRRRYLHKFPQIPASGRLGLQKDSSDLYLYIYNFGMSKTDKPLEWIGSSYKDLLALPTEVRRAFGFALSLAQAGDQHDDTKVLKGFGGAGVLEVVENDIGGTYRAVYTVKFAEAVFVLHCFQKKSKRGIATPKADMDIIHARLRIAEAIIKGLRNEKTVH